MCNRDWTVGPADRSRGQFLHDLWNDPAYGRSPPTAMVVAAASTPRMKPHRRPAWSDSMRVAAPGRDVRARRSHWPPAPACAARQLPPGSAAAHVPHEQLANGDAIVVVRDYVDEFKLDGGTVHKRVRWDSGTTRAASPSELRSNLDGSDLVVIDHPGLTLRATAEELQYAVSLVRADPRFADRVTPALQFDSGFSYREPGNPACYRARAAST